MIITQFQSLLNYNLCYYLLQNDVVNKIKKITIQIVHLNTFIIKVTLNSVVGQEKN